MYGAPSGWRAFQVCDNAVSRSLALDHQTRDICLLVCSMTRVTLTTYSFAAALLAQSDPRIVRTAIPPECKSPAHVVL